MPAVCLDSFILLGGVESYVSTDQASLFFSDRCFCGDGVSIIMWTGLGLISFFDLERVTLRGEGECSMLGSVPVGVDGVALRCWRGGGAGESAKSSSTFGIHCHHSWICCSGKRRLNSDWISRAVLDVVPRGLFCSTQCTKDLQILPGAFSRNGTAQIGAPFVALRICHLYIFLIEYLDKKETLIFSLRG